MTRYANKCVLIAGLVAAGFGLATTATAQQSAIQRKVLLTQDMTLPNYQSVVVTVEIAAGGREGRHTHAGDVAVYVLDGTFTLEHEGKPAATYKTGDVFYVTAGKIHEGINSGAGPVKLIATFVTEKGKPLTTPAN